MSRSKIFRAKEGSTSLRGTIPADVVSALKLKDGDELNWEIEARDNQIRFIVSRASKSK